MSLDSQEAEILGTTVLCRIGYFLLNLIGCIKLKLNPMMYIHLLIYLTYITNTSEKFKVFILVVNIYRLNY